MKTKDSSPKQVGAHLRDVAGGLEYPPTPDIAVKFRKHMAAVKRRPRSLRSARIMAGAFAAVVLVLVIVLSVPQVRAAVLDFLQIGAVTIFLDESTDDIRPFPDESLLQLAGEITLEEVVATVDFPIRTPAYPASLGLPDRVFLQELEEVDGVAPVVILVWMDTEAANEPKLTLYLIEMPFYGIKQASIDSLRQTEVNHQLAYWVSGPHRLLLRNGEFQEWVFVPGNVLIWTDGFLTYRLEAGLSMEEAIRIGESLEPLKLD